MRKRRNIWSNENFPKLAGLCILQCLSLNSAQKMVFFLFILWGCYKKQGSFRRGSDLGRAEDQRYLVDEADLSQELKSSFIGSFYRCSISLMWLVKNPPARKKTWVWSLGWEDPLEKGKAAHSSIWPGEFHGLHSLWGIKESGMTEQLSHHTHRKIEMNFFIKQK